MKLTKNVKVKLFDKNVVEVLEFLKIVALHLYDHEDTQKLVMHHTYLLRSIFLFQK